MSQVRFRYTGATGFTGDTAIDDVSFRNMPTNVEVAPEFQGNSAESSLDLSGVQGLVLLIGEPGDINFGSSLAGNPFDWALAIAPRIAKSQGAYVTPGSQTLNVPFAFPNFYLVNQFTVGSFLPHPGSLNLPLVFASPVVFSAQQIVVNPAHVDGFTLSQAVQLDVVNGVVTAGPTGDDSSVTVSLSGVGGVPFFGTVYTQGFVSSNGRVLFIGADTDFSPTVAEALTDNPFLGCWTDLNPVLGGTITATLSPSGLTTTYDAVPYFEEAAAPTSMEFGIDIAGVVTLDVSGMVPNPLSGTLTASDAVFLGITAGNTGATNPGRTAFRVGASGASASAFDMLYDFVDFNMGTPAVAGQLDSVTALQTGNGVLTFTPRGTLGYSWTGM
jgi:hypothetical protein